MKRCEIVIVGAGPVGLTTAALLRNSAAAEHLNITVVDGGAPPHWSHDDTDLRVYALSKAGQNALQQAGALSDITHQRVSPYARMRVWEGADVRTAAQLCFDSADVGEPSLGAIIEDSLIRQVLFRSLSADARVSLRYSTQLGAIDVHDRRASLALDDAGEPLRANLIIGADGAHSHVRNAAQMDSVERDYGQLALVGHVCSELAHERTAWQRFLPGGPLALLPLADGRCSFVWSLPQARAQRWLEADPTSFSQRLTYASGAVLGRLQLDSGRAALPLVARHSPQYCRERIALVGDAAHSVHPLAGQGANLGLADAVELAREISAAVLAGQDPGDLRVLCRYERARKAANLLMLGALDGLERLFRAPSILAPLRMAGLRIVDSMPILKNQLIQHASGNEPL